jgi:uncharacterized membrane protein YozB (DUF420 family)
LNFYQIIATISFVVQLVVLGLLLVGVWLRTAKKFRKHGITMLAAVVLHAIIIFAWMIPSFGLFVSPSPINLADLLTAVIIVHAFTGVVALILGIWLVASWRLQTNMTTCFAKKNVMRVTITLWLTALTIGIYLYLIILQLLQ